MKFTRKQELALIELGLQKLLEGLEKPKSGRQWSTAQREKFSKSMKKKWTAKKSAAK